MLSRPAWLLLGLSLPAAILAAHGLSDLPAGPADIRAVVAAYSLLPRIAVALLAGAALGLSGGLAQVALRNPLASPGTLGVSAGAALALSAATLYAPDLLALLGRGTIAFGGGAAGIGIVLILTARSRFDPATVALAGLAVGLYAGSIAAALSVLHTRQLSGLFVWSAGTLTQLGWDGPRALLLAVALGGAAAALLSRPLAMLELPDAVARGLGVPVGLARAAALAASVGLAASVVAQVGVIGFVGLAAPALARLGGRRMLVWSSLLGAGLLLLTDQVVQLLSGGDGTLLPTGAFSALLGVPLLLWLLPLVAANTVRAAEIAGRHLAAPGRILLALGGLALGVTCVALLAGRIVEGWAWSAGLLEQRAPRVAAAGIAGVVLAAAGTVLQRVLGNPMASPEVLGLGTGAVAGSAVALWAGLTGFAARFGFGAAGAAGVLALLLLFGRANPTRIVLAGVALSAAAEAMTALLLASGDPRAEIVLLWFAGSTYGTAWSTIRIAGGLLLMGLAACLAAARWLDLLPLGPTVAAALGLPVARARRLMLLLATLLTALGAVLAGPLSFIGLVAPHVADLLGLHRAAAHLVAAALAGATIMIAADWLGRTVLFPSEVPAGMLAALLGGPVLLAALARGRA